MEEIFATNMPGLFRTEKDQNPERKMGKNRKRRHTGERSSGP